MPNTPCFLITPSTRGLEHLRRYVPSSEAECPVMGYHDATAILGQVDLPEGSHGGEVSCLDVPHIAEIAADDPRWPRACACGYVFQEKDNRQHQVALLYRGPDDRLYVLNGQRWAKEYVTPAGAMYDADWYPDKGPDGRCMTVVLPDGAHWCIDGPSSGGGDGWKRTGEPPNITATPSIQTGKWHGFLTGGQLVPC